MTVEVADIKLDVLRLALGIKALEDKELFEKLESFWCAAYKQGCEDTRDAVLAKYKASDEDEHMP